MSGLYTGVRRAGTHEHYQGDIGQVELANLNVTKELEKNYESDRAGTHEWHQRVGKKT